MTVKWNSGTDLPSVVENVQTMTGQRGDGSGKVITVDQLASLGLVIKKISASTGKVTLTLPSSFPGAPDTRVDYPTKPTGFMVESAFSFVVLIWDMPKYAGHSLTEIYRNAEDNLANAVLVGTEAAGVYSDAQNTGQTGFYYWIRHVNADGVPGPYNATAGTYGQTDPNAAQNLIADRVVAGIEIDTPLIRSARIQNGRFTVDENGNVVAINATLNQVTANAGSFYNIVITGATIEDALIADNCTILGTLSAAKIVGDITVAGIMPSDSTTSSRTLTSTITYAGGMPYDMFISIPIVLVQSKSEAMILTITIDGTVAVTVNMALPQSLGAQDIYAIGGGMKIAAGRTNVPIVITAEIATALDNIAATLLPAQVFAFKANDGQFF